MENTQTQLQPVGQDPQDQECSTHEPEDLQKQPQGSNEDVFGKFVSAGAVDQADGEGQWDHVPSDVNLSEQQGVKHRKDPVDQILMVEMDSRIIWTIWEAVRHCASAGRWPPRVAQSEPTGPTS